MVVTKFGESVVLLFGCKDLRDSLEISILRDLQFSYGNCWKSVKIIISNFSICEMNNVVSRD